MRGEIARTAIRFSLDDAARSFANSCAMNQDFADTIARDDQHRAVVEVAREFHRNDSATIKRPRDRTAQLTYTLATEGADALAAVILARSSSSGRQARMATAQTPEIAMKVRIANE